MAAAATGPEKDSVFSNPASVEAGETALEMAADEGEEARAQSPFRVLWEGCRTLAGNVIASVKNPLSLIPAGVISILWIVLTALKAGGADPAPVNALAFLSFADAGLGGGALRTVGGILGKGVFMAAIYRVIDLFRNKGSGEKRGLLQTVKGAFGFRLDGLWSWLLGLGGGLAALAFLSGGLHRYSVIGGVAAAFMAAHSALNGGFVSRLAGSVSRLLGGKGDGGGFTRGLAVGLGLSGLLAAFALPAPAVLIGAAVLCGGALVMLLLERLGVVVPGGKKKGGEAK